uniref:hypothetical protein n=1 Tax=Raoultella ornithinolytica TaxID=54291 RepID=UPI00396A90C8
MLKLIDSGFSICQCSCVFGIQRSDVTLPGLHIGDGVIRQIERFRFLIALPFELGGVGVVVAG